MAPPASSISHLLVLAPNWLGDAVMCTPALRALKRRYPEACLTILGKPLLAPLYEGLDFVDKVLPLPAKGGMSGVMAVRDSFKSSPPDIAVVFPHSFRAALMARASGAPVRVGYKRGGRSFLLTHPVSPHRVEGRITPIYMAEEYLQLAAGLDCVEDDDGLELAASSTELERVRARLNPTQPVVVIAPGAAFGPSKQWPAERYAQVADALTALGAQCVLWTGPGEVDAREAVLRAATSPLIETHDGAPTIPLLKATLSACDLLIGNDSGPRHVAIAFGKPVICIMGSTSPAYTRSPWERGEVIRVDVDCGPCQRPICRTDHRCMTQIVPARVISAARNYLHL